MRPWIAIALIAIAWPAGAAAPPGVDPSSPEARWFQVQKVPGTPNSCCGTGNGRYVDARIVGGHWEDIVPIGEINEEYAGNAVRRLQASAGIFAEVTAA